jgi:riboflavin synthase
MFTGIIEEIGTIKSVHQGSKSEMLEISAVKIIDDIKTGDSISVNGVCLTVVSFNSGSFSADVMPETMRRSNLGKLTTGSRVNIERAMRLSDRLGGHLVSGHIDGIGIIRKIWEEDNAVLFTVAAGRSLQRYIIEKGSVSLDGVSLTVARVDDSSFDVSVIPHTFGNTTLGTKRLGDPINIECDMIAKYIEKLVVQKDETGKITPEFLAEHGFI